MPEVLATMSALKDEPLSCTVHRAAFALQQVGYSAEFVQRLLRAADLVKDAEKLGCWQMAVQQGVYGTMQILGSVGVRSHHV